MAGISINWGEPERAQHWRVVDRTHVCMHVHTVYIPKVGYNWSWQVVASSLWLTLYLLVCRC